MNVDLYHSVMLRSTLLVLLFLPLLTAGAEQPGIIYCTEHSFSLAAPRGWVLDDVSGKSQGLPAVLYPKGTNWGDATVVMYANTARKSVEGQQTIEELMDYDQGEFQKRAPTLRVTELPAMPTSDSKVRVLKFSGDEHGNTEAIAYIDGPKAMVMLVMSARNSSDFNDTMPAFRKLVKSYRFLTSDVRAE